MTPSRIAALIGAALWAALCRCAGDCFKELCARFKALGALGGDVAADGRRDAVDGALAAYHGALLGLQRVDGFVAPRRGGGARDGAAVERRVHEQGRLRADHADG